MYKIKLITTDKSLKSWGTLDNKLKEVLRSLNAMQNASFTIDVEYHKLRPAVHNGMITHEWMDSISHPEYQNGYLFVGLHMSDTQRRRWGIKPSIRGAHQLDFDAVSEIYFWADEQTRRGRFNQFVQSFLHELRHAIRRGMGLIDDTHTLHADGDIREDFAGMDMKRYVPGRRNMERQRTLLEQIVALLTRLRSTPLLTASKRYLGTDASPADRAPDLLGCAESVSMIIRGVYPTFPIITGTWTLNDRLQRDPRFMPVSTPQPGDIIISPTGTVANAPFPGHVGILHSTTTIASNNSQDGLWEENYTLDTWNARWKTAGFPVFFYRLNL